MSPAAKAAPRRWSTFTPLGRRREELASVEPGIRACDDQPRARVRGGFACEIAGIELGDSSVEILEVET